MTTRLPQTRVAETLLSNGHIATIRSVVDGDRPALSSLFENASDESIRLRFFSPNRGAGEEYVEHLFTGPDLDRIALVAEVDQRLVAVATAEIDTPESAEISFLVADSAHRLGLGTLLLEHLAAAARDRGVHRFTAEVLFDNHLMLGVLRGAGFDEHRSTQYGVTTLEMSTAATARALASADARECQSEALSLSPLLHPATVALVGVGREPGGVGREVLRNIKAGGYTGDVFVVHPDVDHIDGTAAFRSLAEVPAHVDLVIVAVPAARVLGVVTAAAESGVSACVVLSSGFSELGARGRAVQHDMVAVARRHSMRLVGPNCFGVISNDPAVRLDATFGRTSPPVGGLAVASQSGGVGIELLDIAHETGLGVASFVSLGNKADVSGNDLLAAWMDDPQVTAAALYLESFGNAPKFARLARTFAERKPLLAVVGGRSSGGRRAGASHTAAAASPSVGVDAMFVQAGVIGCSSIAELADTARLLAEQPLPAGPRLAVIGNVGGLGVLAADAAAAAGLLVPELSEDLGRHIGRHLSGTVGLSNPIDLGAGSTAADLEACMTALLASDEIDSILTIVAVTGVTDAEATFAVLTEAAASDRTKPMTLMRIGDPDTAGDKVPGVTGFTSVEAATGALANAARYADWLTAPRGEATSFPSVAAGSARQVALAALDASSESSTWMDFSDAHEMLEHYGIDAPVGRLVETVSQATAAAEEIGYPVVAKISDSSVVHKTERHLVRIGLRSSSELRAAIGSFEAELGTDRWQVLLQPDLGTHVELALGVVRDPGFGPMVMVASGGVATNILDDRVFLLPPLTGLDAGRAIRSLRIWPLLNGYRGAEPVDVDGLEQLVVALAQLAVDVPEITEMDLNPVMMTPKGAVCVDVKIRVAEVARRADAGLPRRLRAPV
jgi:acyl-CoA synthetase (NDP forming)/GNAT superfamily N-acetyltransferase